MNAHDQVSHDTRGSQPGSTSRETKDLYTVAGHQKVIMFCILTQSLIVLSSFVVARDGQLALLIALGAAWLVSTYCTFRLGAALYKPGTGAGLAVLTLVPVFGFIVFLVVNHRATKTLRAHGIRVGLLGANSDDIPSSVA